MAIKISSDFAILDVKNGRVALAKRINRGERVPVTIRGYIDTVHSNDDGTSIEFSLSAVDAVERLR
jgi:hypothetical protein